MFEKKKIHRELEKINKSIEKYIDEDGVTKIELRFPYNKKIISLVRHLKDRRGLPVGFYSYDGELKKWTFLHTDITSYYLTLIAVRYDFKFVDGSLLFHNTKKPLDFFHYNLPTHFNIKGYDFMADQISKNLK